MDSTPVGRLTPMHGVEIHDMHPSGYLALDLRDIVECLGSAAEERVWTCKWVECTGEATPELTALSDSGESFAGHRLAALARRVDQVIDGDFLGTQPGETTPTLVIRAVDSSWWEVHGDELCIERIGRRFTDVRPARYAAE